MLCSSITSKGVKCKNKVLKDSNSDKCLYHISSDTTLNKRYLFNKEIGFIKEELIEVKDELNDIKKLIISLSKLIKDNIKDDVIEDPKTIKYIKKRTIIDMS